MDRTSLAGGPEGPRLTFPSPTLIIAAITFVFGLAHLGDFQTAALMGFGYLAISACYLKGYKRE